MKKKVYITLHGYKRPGWNDFSTLEQAVNFDGEVVIFDYYDSTKKDLIDRHLWIENVKEELQKWEGYEIIIIGYSVGAVVGMAAATDFDNVTKIFAITPAVKTQFMRWILKGLIFPYYLLKKLFKRMMLGKEEYIAYKESKSRGASEPFPMKMTLMINAFKINLKKQFANLRNKDIAVFYAANDGIVDVKRSRKYLETHIDSTNKFSLEFVEESHYLILDEGSTIYPEIQKFINEDS